MIDCFLFVVAKKDTEGSSCIYGSVRALHSLASEKAKLLRFDASAASGASISRRGSTVFVRALRMAMEPENGARDLVALVLGRHMRCVFVFVGN